MSPTRAAIKLPDYVITAMNKQKLGKTGSLLNGPRLAGSRLDPLKGKHSKAKSAFKDMSEFWKR